MAEERPRLELGWVAACNVDLLQLSNRDLGVDLRRLQVRVAKHFLDEANVCAAFKHQRGHGRLKSTPTERTSGAKNAQSKKQSESTTLGRCSPSSLMMRI